MKYDTKTWDLIRNGMEPDPIREKMSSSQLWEYISTWKDVDDICSQMEEWDTETKLNAIEEIKLIMSKKRRRHQ